MRVAAVLREPIGHGPVNQPVTVVNPHVTSGRCSTRVHQLAQVQHPPTVVRVVKVVAARPPVSNRLGKGRGCQCKRGSQQRTRGGETFAEFNASEQRCRVGPGGLDVGQVAVGQHVVFMGDPPVLVELLYDRSSACSVRCCHAASGRGTKIFVVRVPKPIGASGENVGPRGEHENTVRACFGGPVRSGTPAFCIERFGARTDGDDVSPVGGFEDTFPAVARSNDGQRPGDGSSVGVESARSFGVGRGVVAPRI